MEKNRLQVALKDVRFYAFHGFYPEEQLIGSVFYLDIAAECDAATNLNDDLSQTLNYERLFTIAKQEMNKTAKLIETVAQNILNQITKDFPQVHTAQVSIRKMNPPLSGEVGQSQVTLTFNR